MGHNERQGETVERIWTLPLAESYITRQNKVLPCRTWAHARLSPFAHSSDTERMKKRDCISKSHSPVHDLIPSSGSLKVDSEPSTHPHKSLWGTESVAYLFLKKKNDPFARYFFWQISSPRLLFEPSGRAEEGLTCSLALAVPLQVAGTMPATHSC